MPESGLSTKKNNAKRGEFFPPITQVEIEGTDLCNKERKAMEDKKDCYVEVEKAQAIKLDRDIEELESREAPKLVANHNETMLRSNA